MKKIALDFDSVLSDTMIAWTSKYNEKHKTEYTKDHIRDWSFWKQKEFDFDRDYAHTFFRSSWEDWNNLQPTEQNLDKKVTKLMEFGNVEILTNVDKDQMRNIENWLDKQNIPKIEIIPTECKDKIGYSYDLFIDDDPGLAKDACSKNKKCFVYHQKWNKDVDSCKNITRVQDLTHAIDEISKKGL